MWRFLQNGKSRETGPGFWLPIITVNGINHRWDCSLGWAATPVSVYCMQRHCAASSTGFRGVGMEHCKATVMECLWGKPHRDRVEGRCEHIWPDTAAHPPSQHRLGPWSDGQLPSDTRAGSVFPCLLSCWFISYLVLVSSLNICECLSHCSLVSNVI